MSTPTRYNLFLSTVTDELGNYRLKLAEWLRRKGLTVCVQETFRQGPTTLLESLAAYVERCDAVILLVGERCGEMPSAEHTATLVEKIGQEQYAAYCAHSGETSLSYTQWEGLLARHYGCRLYVYTTGPAFVPDKPHGEDAAAQRRQQAYRAWFHHWGKHTEPFSDWATLLGHVSVQDFPTIPLNRPRNLPESLREMFQGREEAVGALRRQLAGSTPTDAADVPTAVIVSQPLHGLGGVGKTRLAVEYGWRYHSEYSALLLVTADTPADLDRTLAALCRAAVLNLDEKNVKEEAQQREAVLRWLRTNHNWLLILDNLDTPAAQRAAKALLKDELPTGAQGHVLLTSRLDNWSNNLHPLALDVLTEDAAVDLLLSLTENKRRLSPDDQQVALTLARELGQLPLALEQAAAYISTRHISFRAYLEKWQANYAALLNWYDEDMLDSYPRSVAATWQTSFDQLRQESPDAALLLNRLAWLAPDPIPEKLLKEHVPGAPPYTQDPDDVLSYLTRYSLAKKDLSGKRDTFTVHRLVQAVTRQRLEKEDKAAAQAHLLEALNWVNAAFKEDPRNVIFWPDLDPLLPHALAVTDAGYTEPLGSPAPTSRLLNQIGVLLNAKARLADAEPLMRRTLAIDEQSFGPQHPNVAIRLNNLAQLLKATNRLGDAEPLMRRALAIDEQSFGPQHPNVAIRLSNLASLLQATNRLGDAEPLMRRALAIDEQSFGPQHPKVAIRLNNLAQLLQATNRLGDAEPLMRRALAIDEQSFGPQHPNVATDLNNLAQLLQETNRLAEAEPLMRRAFLILASLDWEHPNTRMAVNNYGGLLLEMGYTEEQVIAHIRTLLE